jgi:hypothetical protein
MGTRQLLDKLCSWDLRVFVEDIINEVSVDSFVDFLHILFVFVYIFLSNSLSGIGIGKIGYVAGS